MAEIITTVQVESPYPVREVILGPHDFLHYPRLDIKRMLVLRTLHDCGGEPNYAGVWPLLGLLVLIIVVGGLALIYSNVSS